MDTSPLVTAAQCTQLDFCNKRVNAITASERLKAMSHKTLLSAMNLTETLQLLCHLLLHLADLLLSLEEHSCTQPQCAMIYRSLEILSTFYPGWNFTAGGANLQSVVMLNKDGEEERDNEDGEDVRRHLWLIAMIFPTWTFTCKRPCNPAFFTITHDLAPYIWELASVRLLQPVLLAYHLLIPPAQEPTKDPASHMTIHQLQSTTSRSRYCPTCNIDPLREVVVSDGELNKLFQRDGLALGFLEGTDEEVVGGERQRAPRP
ncbi:hypothetical protein RJZ56_005619 [Blastomyces dermatitidis]